MTRPRFDWERDAHRVLVIILAAAVLAVVLSVAACGPHRPCAGHGGVSATVHGWFYCNDGTMQ